MALRVCRADVVDSRGREMGQHGTALFPVACYHDDLREAEVPWHWHDEWEVLVVERGTVRVAVNGRDALLGAGEGLFINAGALHGVWRTGEGGGTLRSVVFHPRLVGGGADSIFWQKYAEPLLFDTGRPCLRLSPAEPWEREAVQTIGEVWQLCMGEEEGYEFAVRERLSRLLFLFWKYVPSTGKKPPEKTRREQERIKAMLGYIREHLGEELTLGRIAEKASVSENECLRCFRSMVGVPPIRYVRQLRVQRAAGLLASTDGKIEEIGAECGFQDMSYFAKTFRKFQGCTPGEFRKRSRPGREEKTTEAAP